MSGTTTQGPDSSVPFGCPRAGDINSLSTRAKLKYKNAVKLAAQYADESLNDKLLDYRVAQNKIHTRQYAIHVY